MTVLQTLADQIATAIHNANVFAQQEERLAENERLLKARGNLLTICIRWQGG